MRTTITLDEDIARLLNREMRRTGESFKSAVNRYLRRGLVQTQSRPPKPFRVKPQPMGLPPGMSYDNIEVLLDAVEGPARR